MILQKVVQKVIQKKVLLKKSKKGKAGAGVWGDVSGWKEGRNISGVGDQTAYRKTIECPSLTLRTIKIYFL